MNKIDQKGVGNAVIIALVVVVLAIAGIAYMQMSSSESSDDSAKSTSGETSQQETASLSAADVRVALNNALREHVNIAGVALRNVYTDSPDAAASVAALDKNSEEVAGLVGAVYGADAEESFLALWRNHIEFFANYTVAAKNGDQDGMTKALADLDGYTEEASTFFSSANPNLPKETVKEVLGHHKTHVIDTINLIGAGDFDAAYLSLADAADQAGEIANALAGGIAAQFPEKFSD